MCTEYWLIAWSKLAEESVGKLSDRPNMTIAVDWDVKSQTKQTKPAIVSILKLMTRKNNIVYYPEQEHCLNCLYFDIYEDF